MHGGRWNQLALPDLGHLPPYLGPWPTGWRTLGLLLSGPLQRRLSLGGCGGRYGGY